MSHRELDKTVFAHSPEWRAARASIAANVRHGHNDLAQWDRKLLPHLKQLGLLRVAVNRRPGVFELGTVQAETFYEIADYWLGVIFREGSA